MAHRHTNVEKFSLSEYARLQRTIHRQILVEHQQQGKIALPLMKPNEPDRPRREEDSNSESSDEETLNVDDYYFLQPLPARQRRILLRQAGIKKIDAIEKEECREIRSSREFCGCECRVYCDPDTCLCSKSGIRCQVDRMAFPCGCTRDGCRNTRGRIEFNPVRVRTHFIRTLMQLEMEKKLEAKQFDGGAVATATAPFFQMSVMSPPRKKACVASGSVVEDAASLEEAEDGSAFDEKNSGAELHEQLGRAVPNALDRESYEKNIFVENVATGPDGSFDGADMTTGMSESMQFFTAQDELQDGATVGCMNPPLVMMYPPGGYAPDVAPEYDLVLAKKDEGSSTEGSDCTSEGSEDADSITDFSSCDAALYDGRQTQLDNHCSIDSSCKHPHATSGVFDHMAECKSLGGGAAMESGYSDGRLAAEKYAGTQPYKLEPISEILNPIRFTNYTGLLELQTWGSAEYPAGVTTANGSGMIPMNGSYPSMVPSAPVPIHPSQVPSNFDMVAFQVIGGGSSDMMSAPSANRACSLIQTIPAPDATCCEDFIGMNHVVPPFVKHVTGYLDKLESTTPGISDPSDAKAGLCEPSSLSSGLQDLQYERPKYHEMLSSTQPSSSGLESVLSSLHSDLLTPAEFHPLGQSSEVVRPCSVNDADGALMTFGLSESGFSPKPSRADAVKQTPLSESGESSCCMATNICSSLSMSSSAALESDDAYDVLKVAADGMTSCSKADDTLMQNFGEIIKESIVGTASA